jgi:hypothetical protein
MLLRQGGAADLGPWFDSDARGKDGIAMTLDVYADLFDDDLTAVADKLSERVGKMWARSADGAR